MAVTQGCDQQVFGLGPQHEAFVSVKVSPDDVQRSRPLFLNLLDESLDLHVEVIIAEVGAIWIVASQTVKRNQELD